MTKTTKIAAALLGACCFVGAGVALTRSRTAAASASQCTLAVPHSSIDPLVFPTKGGSEALDAAIIGNADDDAIRRVISEQGGVTVPHGTSCTALETGATYARVLIVGGPLAGKAVWAPAMHTHGDSPASP